MDVPKIWVVVFDMHTVIDGLYTIYSIQFHLIRLISRLLMTICLISWSSLSGLNPGDKIKDLGSRTFFLCSKQRANEISRVSFQSGETAVTVGPSLSSSSSSCGREIQNIWYNKLVGCLLSWA